MNTPESSKRVRFTYEEDLCLLKEVAGHNPLAYPDNWNLVQENLQNITGKYFIIRTLKDHVFLMLNLWKKKSAVDQKRSGVEEVYSEKDKLLQEVADMCAELNVQPSPKRRKVSKEKQIIELGRKMREDHTTQWVHKENTEENGSINLVQDQDLTYDVEPMIELMVGDAVTKEVPRQILAEVPSCSNKVPATKKIVIVTKEKVPRQLIAEVVPPSSHTVQAAKRIMPVNKEEVPRQIIAEVPSGSKTIEATNKITTPARSRQNRSVLIRKNGMDYLKNKHDKQYNLRERELALEEKKVELEDKRLQLEQRKIQLQENKWENEFNERKLKMELELQHIRTQVSQSNNSIALIESQAKVIETLLKRLERYEN